MTRTLTMSFLIPALIGLAACSPSPEVGKPLSNVARNADYPRILPLDTLLAQQPEEVDIPALTGSLTSRAAALRARAAALRGSIVDGGTRARMQDALAQR
ncbi:hypothetical protein [Aliiroseovarius crassostreae]|uniref:hypothetical protein n=1 Tax=Aliiroseovarius crassostreae TaxID=154981 RepID=UPI003C7A3ED6